MIPRVVLNSGPAAPETYPLGEKSRSSGEAFALVSFRDTAVEQRIYVAMLSAADAAEVVRFTSRLLAVVGAIRSTTLVHNVWRQATRRIDF